MRKHKISFLISKEDDINSILFLSFFSGWMLSFPFLGSVLYGLYDKNFFALDNLCLIIIISIFLGHIVAGYISNSIEKAKRISIIINYIAIVGSMVFFFPYSRLWDFTIILLAFLGGIYISNWAFYCRVHTTNLNRMKAIAMVLIFSNIIMLIINIISINISPLLALLLTILSLVASLIILKRTEVESKKNENVDNPIIMDNIKSFVLLYIFITMITINSGLMYSVISPAYSHHKILSSVYWTLPYILGIYFLVRSSKKVNKAYILYLAISLIGLSFLLFLVLDRSAMSYIIINTLMMGAFGVCDLFWWSIIGQLLDYSKNPAKLLGLGLSANVLGILIGDILGSKILSISQGISASILAVIVVFIILMILPFLNKYLSIIIDDHIFLFKLYREVSDEKECISNYPNLTDRENEIVELLFTGRTYKMIAEELYLSENTIKTHIKNIYSKYNVQSKVELIKKLQKNLITQKR